METKQLTNTDLEIWNKIVGSGDVLKHLKINSKLLLCTLGCDAVKWTMKEIELSHDESIGFFQRLIDCGVIAPVVQGKAFQDAFDYYYQVDVKPRRSKQDLLKSIDLEEAISLAQHPTLGIQVSKKTNCFTANDAITWFVQKIKLENREEGIMWGQYLLECKIIQYHSGEISKFKDKSHLYSWRVFYPQVTNMKITDAQFDRDSSLSFKFGSFSFVLKWEAMKRAWESSKHPQIITLKQTPPYITSRANTIKHSQFLHGFVLTTYKNTGTYILSNLLDETIVKVTNPSVPTATTINFPEVITVHSNTLRIFNIISRSLSVYTIDVDNIQDIINVFVDQTHFVIVTKKLNIFYWSTNNSQEIKELPLKLKFAPTQQISFLKWPYLLLATSTTPKFILWNLETLKICISEEDETNSIIKFLMHEKKLLVSSVDKLHLWELPNDEDSNLDSYPMHIEHQTTSVGALAVLQYKEDHIVCTSSPSSSLEIESEGSPLNSSHEELSALLHNQNGHIIVTGDINGTLTARKYENGEKLFSFDTKLEIESEGSLFINPVHKINALCNTDGKLIVGHEDCRVTIWDLGLEEKEFILLGTYPTKNPVKTLQVENGLLFFLCTAVQGKNSQEPEVGVISTKHLTKRQSQSMTSPRGRRLRRSRNHDENLSPILSPRSTSNSRKRATSSPPKAPAPSNRRQLIKRESISPRMPIIPLGLSTKQNSGIISGLFQRSKSLKRHSSDTLKELVSGRSSPTQKSPRIKPAKSFKKKSLTKQVLLEASNKIPRSNSEICQGKKYVRLKRSRSSSAINED